MDEVTTPHGSRSQTPGVRAAVQGALEEGCAARDSWCACGNAILNQRLPPDRDKGAGILDYIGCRSADILDLW